MGNIQKINLNGSAFVILSEEDYEDLIDGRNAAEAKARIMSGEDELWPLDVVKALLAGEEPVRVYRKHRGMTVALLAEQTGLSRPYISEIETGKKTGSFDAMTRIARALNVSLDDLAREDAAATAE